MGAELIITEPTDILTLNRAQLSTNTVLTIKMGFPQVWLTTNRFKCVYLVIWHLSKWQLKSGEFGELQYVGYFVNLYIWCGYSCTLTHWPLWDTKIILNYNLHAHYRNSTVGICCEIVLILITIKVVQVSSDQCWSRSMSPHGGLRPQWVNDQDRSLTLCP